MKLFVGLSEEFKRAPLNSFGALAGLGSILISLGDILPGATVIASQDIPVLQTSVIVGLLRWYVLSVGCLYGLLWIGSLVIRRQPFSGTVLTTMLAFFGALVCSFLSYTIVGGGFSEVTDELGHQILKVAGFAVVDLSWLLVFSWGGFWLILNSATLFRIIKDADDPDASVFYFFATGIGLFVSLVILGWAHTTILDGLIQPA